MPPNAGPDYEQLPFALRAGMRNWIESGLAPGSFLSAVLANDLLGAVTKADPYHLPRIRDVIYWLLSEAPPSAYGSAANFDRWHRAGGISALQPKPRKA